MDDAQLLDRFVTDADEAAFRALVVRHGPSVRRVCLSVLGDVHEADDAFQATFLVFVQKAVKVDEPELLGNWLRGVAYKVSIHAKQATNRRRRHESKRCTMQKHAETPDPGRRDVSGVVREELDRLPDSYRRVIAACYLDGLTHEEAAQALGWPVGTVKVRLVRGRKLLRERLDHRGVTLGAALFLMLLGTRKAEAVSDELVDSTVEGMSLRASGKAERLATRYPRSFSLCQAMERASGFLRFLPVVVTVVAILASGSIGRAMATRWAQDSDDPKYALPSNLTDVLSIECR